MKKYILIFSAAALALASCAKTETVVSEELHEISFTPAVNMQTKARSSDIVDGTALPGDFVIIASASQYSADGVLENGAYFKDVKFVADDPANPTKWIPEGGAKLYWPVGGSTLDIVAGAGYEGTWYPGGIVTNAYDASPFVPTYDVSTNLAQGFKITYSFEVVEPWEYLYAAKNKQSFSGDGSVSMTFHHWAPVLIFNAKDINNTNNILIYDIRFTGGTAFKGGTFHMDNTKTVLSAGWSSLSGNIGYIFPDWDDDVIPACNTGVTHALANYGYDGNNDYSGPVTNSYYEYGFCVLPEQEQQDITISYCIGTDLNTSTDSWNTPPSFHQYTYHVDRRARWEMGKKYIYNIEFDLNEIKVTGDVEDYAAPAIPNIPL